MPERDGRRRAVYYFSIPNKRLAESSRKFYAKGKPVAEQEIGKQLLLETAAYAESSVCRRKALLHYFGEEYMEEKLW